MEIKSSRFKNTISSKKLLWITACIITITLTTLLVIIATFGKPVADQFSFINRFNNYGTSGLISNLYQENSGRISQALGIGLSYQLFGDMRAQIIVPILLLICLSVAFSVFFYLILKRRDNHILKSITLGTLSATILLYVAPCLFDVYLWLDSGFVYLGSTIGLILNLDIFIWTLKTPNFFRKKYFIPLAFLSIMNLLFNEATMALAFGWSLLILGTTCIFKPYRKYKHAAIFVFTISTIAALIMVCAPGTWSRVASESGSAGLLEILFRYPINAIRDILSTWTIWKITLASLLGIILGNFIFTKTRIKHLCIVSLLSFLTISYGTLIIIFYGQKYGGVASRTMFTPNLGIFITITLLSSSIYLFTVRKIAHKTFVTLTVTIILCLIGMSGFLRFNRDFISVLAIRNHYISQRDTLINEYKLGKTDKLVLPDIPIMIANSNASDFTVNNSTYYDWFFQNFAVYHNIPAEDIVVQGGNIKSDWWETQIPAWYQISKMQICVENNSLVDAKYICSNQ